MKLLSAENKLTPLAYVLLALLAVLLYVPGQATLPAVDRDEARFAQATKQMIASGDYMDIKYQDEHRYKKPAGIYWLQAAAVELTGANATDIWAYRMPSLLGIVGSVLMTALIGSLLFGGRVGGLAALLLAGSVLLHVEARMAKTDAMLLLSILCAQYTLLRLWVMQEKHLLTAVGFWLALAVGILLKGPIILIPIAFTLGGLCWRERSAHLLRLLQPAIGLPLLILFVAPWFIAITLKTGGAFWAEAVGKDLMAKVNTGSERNMIPPGYYLIVFWVTFWPACLLVARALPWMWAQRREPKVTALLLWVLPTWIVFEAFMTKLPHYTLPTFPALAILAVAAWHNNFGIPRWWYALTGVAFAIGTVVLTLAVALLPLFASGTVMFTQIMVAGAVLAILIWWLLRGDTLTLSRRIVIPTLLSGILLTTLFGHTLPQWNYIWIARQTAQAIATQTDCPSYQLLSARFNEPSLVFHVGTNTILDGDGEKAARHIAAAPCNFALVDRKNMEAFGWHVDTQGQRVQEFGRIAGFSYGGGDAIDMTLYRSKIATE